LRATQHEETLYSSVLRNDDWPRCYRRHWFLPSPLELVAHAQPNNVALVIGTEAYRVERAIDRSDPADAGNAGKFHPQILGPQRPAGRDCYFQSRADGPARLRLRCAHEPAGSSSCVVAIERTCINGRERGTAGNIPVQHAVNPTDAWPHCEQPVRI